MDLIVEKIRKNLNTLKVMSINHTREQEQLTSLQI